MAVKVNKTILAAFFPLVSLFASSLEVTSDVSTVATWDADTVYINKEYFEVKSGAHLTIMPGTHVIFKKAGTAVKIRGTISAKGTSTDSIRFTRLDSDDYWKGLYLTSRNREPGRLDTSVFEYCSLKNGIFFSTDSLYERQGGVLHCGTGNYVSLSHCTIANVKGDIGGAVYCDSGSVVRIDESHFTGNTASYFGGGAIMTSEKGAANLFVQNCRFDHNYARTGGAVRIAKGTKAEFNNCIFYKDTTHSINPELGDLKGGALAVFGPSDVTLRGCIIFHCKSYLKGGGIYSSDASLKLINCTVVNNWSFHGGGIYFARDSAASSPLLVNTIEGGNGTLSSLPRDSAGCGIFLDSSVTPSFRYCQLYDTVYDHTINPYEGEFQNSRYRTTHFVFTFAQYEGPDTVVAAYQLHKRLIGSDPAINGGTPDTTGLGLPQYDLNGKERINGDAIDIGALEYHGSGSPVSFQPAMKKQPQSFSGSCNVDVYSLDGRKLDSFETDASARNVRSFIKKKLSRGAYLLILNRSGEKVYSDKIIVQ